MIIMQTYKKSDMRSNNLSNFHNATGKKAPFGVNSCY